ncbi:trypsin-like peptidase domain-containing protein [Chitiniphilus purpureus]|uniref:Trypsin-like peptidase domain-containing protein n=1 Tax=Chitiniphilus purpureus TaxID=2981137 RepID=A0ABY6DUF7_9NEIS|nr:trypsin-like peptidase domain-containing protein [Chitiniphilus sp. CD1]UXY15493.1 trypsin-like peptidase domain-containing protein [Chitiniphilus sp. CD1]
MKNLQDATERICELKGSLVAMDALLPALLKTLPPAIHEAMLHSFEMHAEVARTIMLNSTISDHALKAFERDVARIGVVLAGIGSQVADRAKTAEAVLLTNTRISTYLESQRLTCASGFFFRREERLYLITSRHVLLDETSGHVPDRIEIEVHTDACDLTQHAICPIPLYDEGVALWRQASDEAGVVDIAVIDINAGRLPGNALFHAFDQTHLDPQGEDLEIGDPLMIVGFPPGFHDTAHHLAIARSASLASAHGVRFQQQGYFLTDTRTHCGSSGAAVLRRRVMERRDDASLPWQLLGVYSPRLGAPTTGLQDGTLLGLGGAWYADVLLGLTSAA